MESGDLFTETAEGNVIPFQLPEDRRPSLAHEADYQLLGRLVGAPTAKLLIGRFGGLAAAFGADTREVNRIAGENVADLLGALQEVAVRIARGEVSKRPVISSWSALLAYVRTVMAHEPREAFRVLFLDKKNQLIADKELSRGTVDHAPVYPREVITEALYMGASAVILVHNHPSGDPTPSAADVDMTRQVVDAGKALRIAVHDHLVVGRDGVSSFKALGLF
jgi:DNA repair protein RadC